MDDREEEQVANGNGSHVSRLDDLTFNASWRSYVARINEEGVSPLERAS